MLEIVPSTTVRTTPRAAASSARATSGGARARPRRPCRPLPAATGAAVRRAAVRRAAVRRAAVRRAAVRCRICRDRHRAQGMRRTACRPRAVRTATCASAMRPQRTSTRHARLALRFSRRAGKGRSTFIFPNTEPLAGCAPAPPGSAISGVDGSGAAPSTGEDASYAGTDVPRPDWIRCCAARR